MSLTHPTRAIGAFAALVALVAGCQSPPDEPAGPPSPDSPYAAEFALARSTVTDPTVLTILEDDHVSEQEILEYHEKVGECVRSAGFEVIVEIDQMTYGDMNNYGEDVLEDTITRCGPSMATLERLYEDPRLNPQRLPLAPTVTACLVDRGLVPDGFTVEDFEAGWDREPWPEARDEEAQACWTEPFLPAGP